MSKSVNFQKDIKIQNLNALIASIGSIAEFNEKIGRSRRDPYLYSLIRGDKNPSGSTRSLGVRMCRDIEKALNLSPGYMSENHDKSAETFDGPKLSKDCPDCVPVKILKELQTTQKTTLHLDADDMAANFPGRAAEDFSGAIIQSDDMAPEFIQGDRILIDLKDTAPAPGFFALDIGGRIILRRVKSSLDGSLRLYADSMPGESMPLDTEKQKIIGRVVYHWRGRKL